MFLTPFWTNYCLIVGHTGERIAAYWLGVQVFIDDRRILGKLIGLVYFDIYHWWVSMGFYEITRILIGFKKLRRFCGLLWTMRKSTPSEPQTLRRLRSFGSEPVNRYVIRQCARTFVHVRREKWIGILYLRCYILIRYNDIINSIIGKVNLKNWNHFSIYEFREYTY